MVEIYDTLFNDLKFGEVRNQIFDRLNSDLDTFISQNDEYKNLEDFKGKFIEYKKHKKDIIYFNFKFDIHGIEIYFYHKDYQRRIYSIKNLKKFQFSKHSDGSDAKDEWIFDDDYLMYLISKIYKMKNPKFAHKIESIGDETSIISIKENNLQEYIWSDYNIIYDAEELINFDEILEEKNKTFEEREKDVFFRDLIEVKETNQLHDEFSVYKNYCTSLDDVLSKSNLIHKKTIIFHNEDTYFRYNLFNKLKIKYDWGILGNFYINFGLFRNCKRHKMFERIAYFLSFLFSKNYPNFRNFFEEKIKYKISDDLDCWKEIISEIKNYFENNIFEKKENNNESSNANKEILNEGLQLFNNVDNKKFIIIFDNILTNEENQIVESIIKEYSIKNFTFFIIYPLMNEFTENKFIEYVNKPSDSHSPFSLHFANIIKFYEKSPKYEEKVDLKIFGDKSENEETVIYDLIRIFNFKSIFVNSIHSDKDSKSLIFLVKYMKYLNINFDNINKKIIDIAFKNKNIENQFRERYENILTSIKTKQNISLKNIIGQRDGYDLEKIIISEIIYSSKEKYETLEVQSIFGLKKMEKEKQINYQYSNFFIKQKSLNAEMFDFAFKIIIDNKQYLKITQVTSIKTEEEKEKLSLEKMIINCSYLKKEFEENDLGNIDGISFCIIAPLRILEAKYIKNYKDLKRFCRENNYEFILFDFEKKSFYKKENKKINNIDIFDFNRKYQLDIIDFDKIIEINKPLNLISLRKVKERDECMEDTNAQIEAINFIKENIKRIAKFEYIGKFADLKRLKENYFAYIYFKDLSYAYFYKDGIINNHGNMDMGEKKLTLILYCAEMATKNYLDSSPESTNNNNQEKLKKNKSKREKSKNIEKNKKEENINECELKIEEKDETIQEKSNEDVINSKKKRSKKCQEQKEKTENINMKPNNKKFLGEKRNNKK